MRVFVKTIPCKNLTASLSGSSRNGRYTSMVQIVSRNCEGQNDGHVIERSMKHDSRLRPAENYSVDKSQSSSLLLQKVSASALEQNGISWPLSETKNCVKRKIPFNLPNKSLSTSSIAWIKKTYKNAETKSKLNPNYDYPYLSKIFGTEGLLMRSNAYIEALSEAARRRAALKPCNTASNESNSDLTKRPQVINIKGWGISKTNKHESKSQTSNTRPTPTKNTTQANSSSTKDVSKQSCELWNADKLNIQQGFKSSIEASNPCPPPKKRTELSSNRNDPCTSRSGCTSDATIEMEIKPCFFTQTSAKRVNEDTKQEHPCKTSYFQSATKSSTQLEMKTTPCLTTEKINGVIKKSDAPIPSCIKSGSKSNIQLEGKNDNFCNPSNLWTSTKLNSQSFKHCSQSSKLTEDSIRNEKSCNPSKPNEHQKLKSKTQTSAPCPPTPKLQKHADGDCKKSDPCKTSEPCKPTDPCNEKLDKLKRDENKNRNKMPTGCVDPKCKKDDKCKKSPKSPYKTAHRRRIKKRASASSAAVKRMRGCENKGDDRSSKPICKDHCKENKSNDIEKTTEKIRSPCIANKIKDQHKDDPCKKKDPCASSMQMENLCGGQKVEPCQDKKTSPCGSRIETNKTPCTKYQKNEDPCKTVDTIGSSKHKEDPSKKNIGSCGSNKQNDKKTNPCVSRKKESNIDPNKGTNNPCKKNEDASGSNKKDNSCGSSKQTVGPCQKPEESSERNKQKDNLCGNSKQKIDPCKRPNETSGSNMQKEGCSQQKVDPCKKPEEASNKQKENTYGCQDKKSSPCMSRKEESTKDPRKFLTGTEKKEQTIANQDISKPKADTKSSCTSLKESRSACGTLMIDPCKATVSGEKKEETSRDCGKPKVETKSNCSNIKELNSKKEPTEDPCKGIPSAEKKDQTAPKPNADTKSSCSNLKESRSACGTLIKDPCKATVSDEKKEPTSPCKPKINANREVRKANPDTKSSCTNLKESRSACGTLIKDPYKATVSVEKKEETSRDCGKPKVETKSNCSNIKELNSKKEPTEDLCKGIPSAEKKEQAVPKPNVDTKANCSNLKGSRSACGTLIKDPCKATVSDEKKEPTSPCKPKMVDKQDFGKPNKDTNISCSNIKKSSSPCRSRKQDSIKDSGKATGSCEKKSEANPFSSKTAASKDCGKPKRLPNIKECLNTFGSDKEKSTKEPSKACAGKKEPDNANKPKTTAKRDCGKPKRDTKPNCINMKKSFSTLTISANQSLSSMIKRTVTTLSAIRNNIFIRNFSSKSGNKKDQENLGRKSQCKSVGTTVPVKRKPAFNPHPNESLRQCYPSYDMDCKKLCKDARKTDCKPFAFLEETNNNKRKGKK